MLLVVCKLLPLPAAWDGVLKGLDVYLFLIGMMALAEVARREGLFDWLAGPRGARRQRLVEPAVPADLRRRHRRHDVSSRTMPPPSC